jgi:glyoxylase-like metal-dependent hydrolase (beta-lactamase superfamily II)
MILETRAAPPFMKNGFVIGCEASNEAVLIDPGDEVAELLEVVDDRRLAVKYILLTHAHVDHVTGVGRAKQACGAPIALHQDDLVLYERAPEIGLMFGLRVAAPPPVDIFYQPGRVITFGEYEVLAHHTPGHCPGGVCLQVGKTGTVGQHLFVGDTLFAGSIGRTDLPGGDYETLIRSIREVLFRFGDAALVYPGHGPATTIGHERRTNPFLQG